MTLSYTESSQVALTESSQVALTESCQVALTESSQVALTESSQITLTESSRGDLTESSQGDIPLWKYYDMVAANIYKTTLWSDIPPEVKIAHNQPIECVNIDSADFERSIAIYSRATPIRVQTTAFIKQASYTFKTLVIVISKTNCEIDTSLSIYLHELLHSDLHVNIIPWETRSAICKSIQPYYDALYEWESLVPVNPENLLGNYCMNGYIRIGDSEPYVLSLALKIKCATKKEVAIITESGKARRLLKTLVVENVKKQEIKLNKRFHDIKVIPIELWEDEKSQFKDGYNVIVCSRMIKPTTTGSHGYIPILNLDGNHAILIGIRYNWKTFVASY